MFDLRPGISFCSVGRRLVFLDLGADSYFGLTEEGEAMFRAALSADAAPDPMTQAVLAGAGILAGPDEQGVPAAPCRTPQRPRISLLEDRLPAASGPAVAAAVAQLLAARARLRRVAFGAVVARLAARKQRARRDRDQDALPRAMAPLLRAGTVLSQSETCLSRSLVAAERLLGAHLDAELVIGVRAAPFAAHCWVQHGDVLVNDRLDTVRTFTPILVV